MRLLGSVKTPAGPSRWIDREMGSKMAAIYLPSDSQKRLMGLSRQVLERTVCGVEGPTDQVEDPYLLNSRYGSFVSLHKEAELRGCIGTCDPTGPLYKTVMEMTQAAATQDYRFSSITADEIHEIRIEISILSPLEPVTEIQSLRVGVHGLHVTCGEKRGVLLPQVATEYGWDMETFLGQVCLKAELDQGAWRSAETRVSSFSTLVIEEEP